MPGGAPRSSGGGGRKPVRGGRSGGGGGGGGGPPGGGKGVNAPWGVGVGAISDDETRDTFVVEKDGKVRVMVAKGQHTFEFIEGRRRIKVSGSLIARRPEDRLKLKLRW